MDLPDPNYEMLARTYADGVRALLAPSGPASGERGAPGPGSYHELEIRAADLLQDSRRLTQAAGTRLDDPDPHTRVDSALQLLAKSVVDLEVGARLLQAGLDQEEDLAWGTAGLGERAVTAPDALEPLLGLLAGPASRSTISPERAGQPPEELPLVRRALAEMIQEVLDEVADRVIRSGGAAVGGLLGLGLAQVAQAAAVVGADLASALGQAEKVTRLFDLFRQFALNAYNSLKTLLGAHISQEAGQRILAWAQALEAGESLPGLLGKLYDTEATGRRLADLAQASPAGLPAFLGALDGLETLETAFGAQMDVADRLLKGLKLLPLVPATILPQARLLLASAYLLLGAYIILTGADFVDSPRLQLLARVDGVRTLVETYLNTRPAS